MSLFIFTLIVFGALQLELATGARNNINPNICYDHYYVKDLLREIIDRRLQILDYQDQTAKYEREKTDMLEKENDLKVENTNLTVESEKLKAEGAKLKAESEKLKAESEKLKAEGAKLKAEGANLKVESTNMKVEIKNLNLELASGKQEIVCLNARTYIIKGNSKTCLQTKQDALSIVSNYRQANGLDNNDAVTMNRACLNNDIKEVQAMLDLGVKVNLPITSDQGTCLDRAASKNHAQLATSLIARGSNINVRDKNGWTPLMAASMTGSLDVAKLLVKHGADLDGKAANNGDRTALGLAKKYNRTEIIKLLQLKEAVRIVEKYRLENNLANNNTDTMGIACLNNQTTVVVALLDLGVDTELMLSSGGTCLHLTALTNNVDMATLLIQRGANINARISPESNFTPLMTSSWKGSFEVAKFLLEHGADLSVREYVHHGNRTALGLAKQFKQTKLIELFQSNGAQE